VNTKKEDRMTSRPPSPLHQQVRATVDGREEAFREVLGALTDSAFALSRAETLVARADWRKTLSELRDERDAAKRAVIDRGLTAGFGTPEPDTHLAESFRRAWMRLESMIRNDAAVIETLRDEEHTAADRLTSTLDKGMPDTVEHHVRDSIATIRNDVKTLDHVATA
jgi:hypothetical protein